MSQALDTSIVGREFHAGDTLFNEGEPGEEMYVIQHGRVRLSKTIDGTETILAEMEEGEFVGELVVVRGGLHTTTATAMAPTRVLVINAATLEDMVTEDSEIAVRFIQSLASRLAASHDMLATIGARDTRTRVVMAIVRHAQASSDRRPDGIWIDRRLGDIGDEVAVSKAELGEISKQFLKLQLLRIKRDGILVPDVARLYGFLSSGDVG